MKIRDNVEVQEEEIQWHEIGNVGRRTQQVTLF